MKDPHYPDSLLPLLGQHQSLIRPFKQIQVWSRHSRSWERANILSEGLFNFSFYLYMYMYIFQTSAFILMQNNVSYHSFTKEKSTTHVRGRITFFINTGVLSQKCIRMATFISTVQVGCKPALEYF